MPYAEIAPPADLASLVECFWRISGPSSAHRVLPDGCIDIILVGERGMRVVGTMTRAIVVDASARSVFGVRFRAGEAARILPVASHELTDLDAPIGEAWGDEGRAFEERAHDAVEDPSWAARIFVESLRARLARHAGAVDLRVRAAAHVLASGGTVEDAAHRANICERHLTRRFSARVGIAPKTFARVMRLQRAVAAIHRGANASRAAAIAGYADQAHFTRDAKDLAGVTPVRFVQDAAAAAQ